MCVFLCLLRTGEILTLKPGQITLSVDSGVAPLSKGAKLENAGDSIVVSEPRRPGVSAIL